MTADDRQWNALCRFVQDETRVPAERLSPHILMERDLGIHGDEVGDFLCRFGQQFSVDVSGFDMAKHFSPEGDLLGRWLLRLAGARRPADLSMGALLAAIRAGRLETLKAP